LSARATRLWHVGGKDVDLRIPLLLRMRQAGFEVAAAGAGCRAPFEAAGIPYFEYGLAPGLQPWADWAARRRLAALLAQERPALAHAFDTKPGLLLPHAARGAPGVRCVRTITGLGRLFARDDLAAQAGRAVYRAAQRRVAPRCALTVFQNEDDRDEFLAHDLLRGRPHALVRGSGVDAAALRAAAPAAGAVAALRRQLGAEGGLLVLMVARVVPSKGVREFMDAAAQVRADRPATFVLVGPADEGERSAAQLGREAQSHPHVRYLGRRDDVPALLAAADVFALPTWYREGLPRVLLEAAVMRVPIVTTAVPGCREVVHDGVTGLVVPPRDATALAQAIGRLAGEPALRTRLAAAAERHVLEHFSLDRVAADTLALYRTLLDEG